MKAQVIYDLVHQTGWISGNEMHDYLQFLAGEPSPSGKIEIDLLKLKQLIHHDKELLGLLKGLATFGGDKDVKEFFEQIMNCSFDD